MTPYRSVDDPILNNQIDFSSTNEKTNPYIFELAIRRGNHGLLSKTARSVYVFPVEYQNLNLAYLYNIINIKVEQAIADADKGNCDFKYYDVHKTKLLFNSKKPIKDNPYLDTYTDDMLRSACNLIRQRRKSQSIHLDISVSSTPLSKKETIQLSADNTKVENEITDTTISNMPFDNPLPVNVENSTQMHTIPFVQTVNTVQTPVQINSVFQDVDYVPIRAKIQTNELSYNGTILLNRDDLLRAVSMLNYQQFPLQDRSG